MSSKRKDWVKAVVGSHLRYFFIVLAISVLAAYFFTAGKLFNTPKYFFVGTTWSMAIWYSQSLGNGWIIDRLDERISWLERPWTRMIIGFGSLVLYSFVAFQIVQLTFGYFFFGWEKGEFLHSDRFWQMFWFNGRLAVIISLAISIVLTSVGFLKRWKDHAVELERMEKEVYASRYAALRNQVNPHFLFNSLNVLTELVYEDQDHAVSFIRKLGDVYRYVLDSRDRELVMLQEELRFAQDYVDLLKERFGDNFQVEWKVDSCKAEKGYIVPMAIQLLLENTVKHNVVSRDNPLQVVVECTGESVIVSNSLQKKESHEASGGFGLSALEKRYGSLSQGALKIIEDEEAERFSVELPILNVEV